MENQNNNQNEEKAFKKFILTAVGCFILIFGITLVLLWWEDVVSLFKGFIPMVMALAGMVVVYFVNK